MANRNPEKTVHDIMIPGRHKTDKAAEVAVFYISQYGGVYCLCCGKWTDARHEGTAKHKNNLHRRFSFQHWCDYLGYTPGASASGVVTSAQSTAVPPGYSEQSYEQSRSSETPCIHDPWRNECMELEHPQICPACEGLTDFDLLGRCARCEVPMCTLCVSLCPSPEVWCESCNAARGFQARTARLSPPFHDRIITLPALSHKWLFGSVVPKA